MDEGMYPHHHPHTPSDIIPGGLVQHPLSPPNPRLLETLYSLSLYPHLRLQMGAQSGHRAARRRADRQRIHGVVHVHGVHPPVFVLGSSVHRKEVLPSAVDLVVEYGVAYG